jgi:phosphonate transport system permease protein
MAATLAPPAARDPAWLGRVFWVSAGLLLLVPALIAAEFKPWLMLEPENLKITVRFLADFLPPKVEPQFLADVARETWRTVTIATAGITLALVLAIPLTLLSTAALSVSALPGRMHALPLFLRQAVRWFQIAS